MPKPSIIFMGTPEFAVPSLQALVSAGYEVKAVFTQPDRPKGRGKQLAMSPVKEAALALNIPVCQPTRIRKDGVDSLRAIGAELYVTAAFGQILSKEVLALPKMGTVNVHASLLPKHRGSAPIAWGMLMGDTSFGITTMLTDEGIDTGDMLLKCETALLPGETCGELTERLSHMGAELLLKTLDHMLKGTLEPVAQKQSEASYEPMLYKEMGNLDWSRKSAELIRKIRALNPWPCAYTGKIKCLNARESDFPANQKPGIILCADHKAGLIVQCRDGAIELTRIQAPGSKAMDARAYLLGHPMAVGSAIADI